MLLAALAEQVRGGVLLVICILIGFFFFLDAGVNIFGGKRHGKEKKGAAEGDTIRFRIIYKNKICGDDEFMTLTPGKSILVGFGTDCQVDLSSFPLPFDGEEEIWFQVLKNSVGVLMAVKDPAMEGLRVRGPEDKSYRALRSVQLTDTLQIEKDELVIKLEKME
jgi:hypothetical protein